MMQEITINTAGIHRNLYTPWYMLMSIVRTFLINMIEIAMAGRIFLMRPYGEESI